MGYQVDKTDEQWREELSPEEYAVLRRAGTEPAFRGEYTDTVEYIEDSTFGMKRVEVRCASCGSHLGHVFPDGFGTPTGDRYCINSISLTLEPVDPAEPA